MGAREIALIAAIVLVYALVSRVIDRMPLTMPMFFVGLGIATEKLGVVDAAVSLEEVTIVSEVTLGLILFGDAARIRSSQLRHNWGLPIRLLVIGLPLSIALGTIVAKIFLPGLSIAEAALIAAILAPTDAALGQAVVEDESVPARVRQGLVVESGLNDGLALPAVLLFLAIADGETTEAGFWVRFAAEQVGGGLLVGLAVGAIGGWLLREARERGMVEGIAAQLAVLSLAVMSLTCAIAVGANGFIATFVAGLAFGHTGLRASADGSPSRLDEYTEDTGQLLAMVAFFLFGNVLVPRAFDELSIGVVLCAFGALTVGRMVPVAVAMADMRPAPATVGFVGWFGPRGLASILFGLLILEEDLTGADALFGVVALTVLLSVVLHGATATMGARRYGEWYRDRLDRDEMPEAVPVGAEHPARWSR